MLQMLSSPRSAELYEIQFRNFDKWALDALREIPSDYQAFLPAAICIHSSSHMQSLAENGIWHLLSPVRRRDGPLTYLGFWYSELENNDPTLTPASRYLSELLNDASRAAEFLLTETHFTNFALHCAKLAFGVMPCVLSP